MRMLQLSPDRAIPRSSLLLPGKPEPVPVAFGAPPTCEVCQTPEFLVFEKIDPIGPRTGRGPLTWDVDYWCGKCETYYGFQTPGGGREQYRL